MQTGAEQKGRRFFAVSLAALLLTAAGCYAAAYLTTPDRLAVFAAGDAAAASVPHDEPLTQSQAAADEVALSWFGLPLKTLRLDVLPQTELIPLGLAVGVTFRTDGVMVLATGSVTGANGKLHRPAEGLLKPGDLIRAVNGEKLDSKDELIALVENAAPGTAVTLQINRDGADMTVSVTPAVNADGTPKLGVWVRDGTQGVGTLTYYNPETRAFGALGHGILDVDTKKLMTVREGELLEAKIVSVKKGQKGGPGELIGELSRNAVLGQITANTPLGIYGHMTGAEPPGERVPIALQNEVHEGPAILRATVGGKETKDYDVYIESVNRYSADEAKGMVIRITDRDLIAKTNGIVQGMSGSPILQDGKLVGAVTHVFVQNPLKGYGIFIENMLRQEKSA